MKVDKGAIADGLWKAETGLRQGWDEPEMNLGWV